MDTWRLLVPQIERERQREGEGRNKRKLNTITAAILAGTSQPDVASAPCRDQPFGGGG